MGTVLSKVNRIVIDILRRIFSGNSSQVCTYSLATFHSGSKRVSVERPRKNWFEGKGYLGSIWAQPRSRPSGDQMEKGS